jgi:hypothetical protein
MSTIPDLADPTPLGSPNTGPRPPFARLGRGGRVLAAVRDPACVLALWQRTLAGSISDALDRLPCAALPAFDVVAAAPDLRRHAAMAIQNSRLVGTGLGRWLACDIPRLCCRYVAITGIQRMHVRLAAIDHDACRYFHLDRVSYRLLCTYRGPGTQWVPPETHIDPGLRGEALTAALDADPGRIRQAATRSVMLFRGFEPHSAQPGLLHRSPPVGALGTHRLVLTISAGGPFA